MENREQYWVQLFIRYIRRLTTVMVDYLPRAVVNCYSVCRVLHIVEKCCAVCDHCIRILTITAILGSHEFGLCIWLCAQGATLISTGREDLAAGSAGLSMLSEGFPIELSHFEAENAILKGDYLRLVVEIVIGCVPTVLEICCMSLFMSLRRILLQGFIWTNLFDPVTHPVDLWTVEVGI